MNIILHFDMTLIIYYAHTKSTHDFLNFFILCIFCNKFTIPHKIYKEIFTDACIHVVQIEYLYNALEIHCWNIGCRWNIEYADAMKLL